MFLLTTSLKQAPIQTHALEYCLRNQKVRMLAIIIIPVLIFCENNSGYCQPLFRTDYQWDKVNIS